MKTFAFGPPAGAMPPFTSPTGVSSAGFQSILRARARARRKGTRGRGGRGRGGRARRAVSTRDTNRDGDGRPVGGRRVAREDATARPSV